MSKSGGSISAPDGERMGSAYRLALSRSNPMYGNGGRQTPLASSRADRVFPEPLGPVSASRSLAFFLTAFRTS